MKMEHPVVSDQDGVVQELLVAIGSQVESGQLLVVVGDEGP
jgi:biotin carboxyl carrier protein